ncbi:MAG: hypothetical protein LBP26_06270 [Clostridiales bacterium]|jgi:hypothetical protein|nr:hypothetical protein [Clostridiales bacterium]
MLAQKRYSDDEYLSMLLFAAKVDNEQAMCEVKEHQKFFGKRVEVFKGRKCPIGIKGTVFYLSRKHYGKSYHFGFLTRVGIVIDDGEKFWTSSDNIKICNEIMQEEKE